MSGIVRPVTSRIAPSWEIWDATQLPLAVTLQPLWKAPQSQQSAVVSTTPPLAQIVKCPQCGAPHPPQATSYTVLANPTPKRPSLSSSPTTSPSTAVSFTFLCQLCHKISTVSCDQRLQYRNQRQHFSHASPPHMQRRESGSESSDTTSSSTLPTSWTYALPLRLPASTSATASSPYRVPATTCPLLWYLILDGSDRSGSAYWTHVSDVLQATFDVTPHHVHVAVLVIYPPHKQVAVWQVCGNGAIPHLRRYPVNTEGLGAVLAQAVQPMGNKKSKIKWINLAKACGQAPSLPILNKSDTTLTDTGNAWTWIVTELATGLVEVGTAVGQRTVSEVGKHHAKNPLLPYAGAYVTCLRSSFDSPKSNNGSSNKLVSSRLCATSALTVQSVGILDANIDNGAGNDDPPFPLISSLEAPTLAWYATTANTISNNMEDSQEYDITVSPGWETWQAMWPWHRAYGAQLRLRLSPGLVTDDDDGDADETKGKVTTSISTTTTVHLTKQGGLTGPAVAATHSTDLWMLPSLDAHTTVVVDMALDEEAAAEATVSAIPTNGILQMCLAYTALETDEDGQAWTVRRIQLAHRTFVRSPTVESLYRRVDPEALAVVLLQKLVRCEPSQRISIGQEWLQAFLVGVYESALEESKRQAELEKRGITDPDGYFLPADRLLSRQAEGTSTSTAILLAQGHGRLQPIPLLLYLLLQQCQGDGSNNAEDLNRHGLSLSDLVRMSPESLSRCLAPRLQLWSKDKVLVDLIDLNMESVIRTIREERALQTNPRDVLLLVLDAPDQIVVANALACLPDSKERMDDIPYSLNPELQNLLNEMAASYPTPPPILYGGSENNDSWLTRVCKEDLPLRQPTGEVVVPNFDTWCSRMAESVRQELVTRGHLMAKSSGIGKHEVSNGVSAEV